MNRVARSALVLGCAMIFSQVCGLVSKAILGSTFGASSEVDAYLASNRLTETIFNLMAGGALASAFVPTFSAMLDRENEKDADQFAIDTLISADEYAGFLASGDFSNDAIRNFSASIGIHAGIVSGRLAKEGHVDYKEINHLRNSFSL